MSGEQLVNAGGPEESAIPQCAGAVMIARLREEAAAEAMMTAADQAYENAADGSVDAARGQVAPDVSGDPLATGVRQFLRRRAAQLAQRLAAGRRAGATEEFTVAEGFERDGKDYQPRKSAADEVIDCGLCSGTVTLADGGVKLKGCVLTMGCEVAWGEQHPNFYNPNPRRHDRMNTPKKAPTPEIMPCAGDRCTALVRFLSHRGKFLGWPRIEAGTCGVDFAGQIWRAKGIETLNNMQPDPGDDFEEYDGVVVTEEDIAAIEARITGAEED
jgi:hypothetical protein